MSIDCGKTYITVFKQCFHLFINTGLCESTILLNELKIINDLES